MAYFICHDCGEVFHESEAFRETKNYAEDGFIRKETSMLCPSCGNDDFGFACRCERCGEYFVPDKLRGGRYCDGCVSALTTFDNVKKYLSENIDDFAEFIHEQQTET